MRPFTQIPHDPENGVIGDCLRCSVAWLTGAELADVPHFIVDDTQRNLDFTWRYKMERWLLDRQMALVRIHPALSPECHYLAIGPTVRSKDITNTHCVVMRGDELVYDPHESNTGLLGVTHAYVLTPILLNTWSLR